MANVNNPRCSCVPWLTPPPPPHSTPLIPTPPQQRAKASPSSPAEDHRPSGRATLPLHLGVLPTAAPLLPPNNTQSRRRVAAARPMLLPRAARAATRATATTVTAKGRLRREAVATAIAATGKDGLQRATVVIPAVAAVGSRFVPRGLSGQLTAVAVTKTALLEVVVVVGQGVLGHREAWRRILVEGIPLRGRQRRRLPRVVAVPSPPLLRGDRGVGPSLQCRGQRSPDSCFVSLKGVY